MGDDWNFKGKSDVLVLSVLNCCSDLSLTKALVRFSGSLQKYIIPSMDAVMRCLRLVERHIAVVTSPQVVFAIAFPVAVS